MDLLGHFWKKRGDKRYPDQKGAFEACGRHAQALLLGRLSSSVRVTIKSKQEIKEMFSNEIADVFGFLLLFAESEGIDPAEALSKKWFSRLEGS